MKRKEYQKPAMRVVKLKRRSRILTVSSVKSNAINKDDIQSDEGYDGVVR